MAGTGEDAPGGVAQMEGTPSDVVDSDLAARSWHLAHTTLVEELLPSQRVLTDELRAALRLLAASASSLDRRGEWSTGGGLSTSVGAAQPPTAQARFEEDAEGGALTPATIARVAAAVSA